MPKKDILKFNKTLLDEPINLKPKTKVSNNKLVLERVSLPEPLIPTQYVAPKPVSKPRKKAPVALPRKAKPKPLNRKVSKLISLIKQYYSPEKIKKFKKKLKFINKSEIKKKEKAIKGNVANYTLSIVNKNDPSMQLSRTRDTIEEKLKSLIKEKRKGLKFGESLKIRMKKETEDGIIFSEPYFNSKAKTVTHPDMIDELIGEVEEEILNKIADWISEGSNWRVERVLDHYLNIINYQPLRAGSYLELPIELRNSKKGLINLKNEDNKCFLWSHVRHLNPQKKDPQRIKNVDKEFAKKLDYSNVKFPVSLKDINKIEKQNQINISVFGYESKRLFPLRVSDQKYSDHLELLYIQKESNSHYVLIKDFNRLMFNFNNYQHKKHFCMYCLHGFTRNDLLEKHISDCYQINGTQKIELPKPGSKVFFMNYHRKQPVPFVIYSDFEALPKKINTCIPNNEKSYTAPYQEHQPSGYGYKVICCGDQSYCRPYQSYRGEGVIEKFIENINSEAELCKEIVKNHFNKPLIMTPEDELDFQNSTTCHICEKEYSESDNSLCIKEK